jgi:hypothetical protein
LGPRAFIQGGTKLRHKERQFRRVHFLTSLFRDGIPFLIFQAGSHWPEPRFLKANSTVNAVGVSEQIRTLCERDDSEEVLSAGTPDSSLDFSSHMRRLGQVTGNSIRTAFFTRSQGHLRSSYFSSQFQWSSSESGSITARGSPVQIMRGRCLANVNPRRPGSAC